MTELTYNVLSTLRFHYPDSVIGAVLADKYGCSGEKIREVIHSLRCELDENGKRVFIIGDNDGYRITKDIAEAREANEKLRARAMSILEAYKGGQEAIEFMLEDQGLVGTLFGVGV